MPPDPKNSDDLLANPTRPKPDPRAIYDMAHLAHQLGFRSPGIDGLLNSSPDHQIARSALLQARKPGQSRYDDHQFDVLVRRIVDCFTEAVPDQPGPSRDLLADSTVKAQHDAIYIQQEGQVDWNQLGCSYRWLGISSDGSAWFLICSSLISQQFLL
jgi:hypothetical protein